MSIAAVLQLNGVNVVRTVSVSGRVIFGASSERPSAGAPLKPHTFHGGLARQEGEIPAARWWLVPERIEAERAAMAKCFPGFRQIQKSPSKPPVWEGTIDSGRGKFRIRIHHRHDGGLPRVEPIEPSRLGRSTSFRHWRAAPHTFTNGDVCVAAEDDWEPTDTAAVVVGWAAHWFAVYSEWFFTGVWAAEGYRPDAA